MSAYALPGSIFPPSGGSCSSQLNRKSVFSPTPTQLGGKEKKGAVGHFSLENLLAMTTNDDIKDDQRDERCPQETQEVGIAVKEAKIDPVRLVQAVASGDHKCSCSHKAPVTEFLSCCQRTPHEDAIQFELSISYNGRSYSATRTLPRLVQLRNDLVREVNARRKRLHRRRMRWNGKINDNNDDTVATVDDYNDEGEVDLLIPEIPECNTDNVAVSGGGFAGRGFAMLQALLGPYCPAIERWLQHVTVLVPPTSSPSLTNFLWEPVSGDIKCGVIMRASPSLECIMEDSDSEEESEE